MLAEAIDFFCYPYKCINVYVTKIKILYELFICLQIIFTEECYS